MSERLIKESGSQNSERPYYRYYNLQSKDSQTTVTPQRKSSEKKYPYIVLLPYKNLSGSREAKSYQFSPYTSASQRTEQEKVVGSFHEGK